MLQYTMPTRLMKLAYRLPLLVALLAGVPALAAGEAAPGATATRYVWATSLIVRAAPDAGAQELARLPQGGQVSVLDDAGPRVARREVLFKLNEVSDSPKGEVALEGQWRKVHAATADGWVFDGYLSRYPFPAMRTNSHGQDDMLGYARQLFVTRTVMEWDNSKSRNSAAYKVLKQRKKLGKEEEAWEMSWSYVEFQQGGTYERFDVSHDGFGTVDIAYTKLHLNFNEALLWLRWFGAFAPVDGSSGKAIGQFTGTFVPGKSLHVNPDNDQGINFQWNINCAADTCDLTYGSVD